MAQPSCSRGIVPHQDATNNFPPTTTSLCFQDALSLTLDPKTTIAFLALPEASLQNTWGKGIRLRLYHTPGWFERTGRETRTLLSGRGDKAESIASGETSRTARSRSSGSERTVRFRSRSGGSEKKGSEKFQSRRRKTTPPSPVERDFSRLIQVEGRWYEQKLDESDVELRRSRERYWARSKRLAVKKEDERHNYSNLPLGRRLRFSPLLGFEEIGTATGGEGREREKDLSKGTICISTLLTAIDLVGMPSMNFSTIGARRRSSVASITAPSHMKTVTKAVAKEDGKKALDDKIAHERNINQVVLGDTLFTTWYPSWYPNETLPEKEKGKGIVVETLYVCKWCFAYGKCVEDWVQHCKVCERASDGPPGRKIYSHGEKGILSVWEVDGDAEKVASIFLTRRSLMRRPLMLIFTGILPKPFLVC